MMRLLLLLSSLAAILTPVRGAIAQVPKTVVLSDEKPIVYDEFGNQGSSACLIVLHGASGPVSFYKERAAFFGKHDFHVFMPHYFDASGSSTATTANYRTWSAVVDRFAKRCRQQAAVQKVFLVGYSLGASVALAAGSQGALVDAIADWYGSLPDDFFYRMKTIPPLLILHGEQDTNIPIVNGQQLVRLCEMKHLRCEHHFYSDQAHGFSGPALTDAEQRTLTFFASIK